MSTTLTAPKATEAEPAVVVEQPPRPNTIGKIALGLAIVGFILAIFLITAGLAWMFLLPAIGLAIAGLIIPNRRRGVAVAALVVGVIGLLLSFIGFRLPMGSIPDQGTVLNNQGVNPFSVFTGPLPGQTVGGGTTGTGTNSDGLVVAVDSVDCHQPLASVTGLNITGEICAVTLSVTNNGADVVSVDSTNVSLLADGAAITADVALGEGPVLDVDIDPGDSASGLVYVNAPSGSTIDGLAVQVGDDPDSLVSVDLAG